MTGCSTDPNAQEPSREAEGVIVGASWLPKQLPTKFPTSPLEFVQSLLGEQDFIGGLLSCLMPSGCFPGAAADKTAEKLDKLSKQIDGLQKDVATGLAATRLDIAKSDYSRVEESYNEKFGNRIDVAYGLLRSMSDSSLSKAKRNRARADFEREAALLVPATTVSAMTTFMTAIAGKSDQMSKGALLGSAWSVISAKERSVLNDSKGELLPVFLPARSANLMTAMGTQRLAEGAQLLAIVTAYEVLRSPTEYETEEERKELASDLKELWLNGFGKAPGAAAITAALPRVLPSQSGVFTEGFGDGVKKTGGLLIRNFGPVVDAVNRTGPIVSADSGYALTPGIDEWLKRTKSKGDAKQELTVERAGANWQYDPSSGSLTTSVTATSYPELVSELGSLVATHSAGPKAGEVAGFGRVGQVANDRARWELDPENARIHVGTDSSKLCLKVITRHQNTSRTDDIVMYGYDKPMWFDKPWKRPSNGVEAVPLAPRLSVAACADDTMQQWFLQGPVPMDGLPFGDADALKNLSVSNVTSEELGYPVGEWESIDSERVYALFDFLNSRSIDPRALFTAYGSALTPPDDRALPPVLFPAFRYGDEKRTIAGQFQNHSKYTGDALAYALQEWLKGWGDPAKVAMVVFPLGKDSFLLRPVDGTAPFQQGKDTVTEPGMPTAAVMVRDVDTCTFAYIPPTDGPFDCEYKNSVKAELIAPTARLAAGSPLLTIPTPKEAAATLSPSASASPTASSSESASPTASPTSEKSANPKASDDPARPEPTPDGSKAPGRDSEG